MTQAILEDEVDRGIGYLLAEPDDLEPLQKPAGRSLLVPVPTADQQLG